MNLDLYLLFFVSGIGVFNGLLMSLYFLFATKSRRIQNTFFGLLILMLSMRIGKSVFLYFNDDLPKIILQLGLSACFFVGPFLFLYIRSVLNEQKELKKNDIWQLLGLALVIAGIGVAFPYSQRPELWNPEIVQGIYAVWTVYVIATGYILRESISQFFRSPAKIDATKKWLLIVFLTNVLICLVFNMILYLGFPTYISGPITFSFLFYGLTIFLLFSPNSKAIIEGKRKRYQHKKIANQEVERIGTNLQELMVEKRLFEIPSLKLQTIAKELNVTPHFLSQFLNDNLKKSFADFVNEYRIDAACELLKKEHNLSIDGIGKEVGFRSKSSFYAAFKKIHGKTPLQYYKSTKEELKTGLKL